jgi:excisionase family DNA binding protein
MKKDQAMDIKNLQVFTAAEATAILKIERRTLYELLNSGELKGFRVGKSYRVTAQAISDYITNNMVA